MPDDGLSQKTMNRLKGVSEATLATDNPKALLMRQPAIFS